MQGPVASDGMLLVRHQASLHLHTHLSVTRNPLEKHKSEKLLDPPQRQFMGVCELQASRTDGYSGVNIA